jgi:extradiol dioxygenase family protein
MSGLVFNTDDIRGLYETLQARGVTDFTQEPIEHFYGTDMGLRDPFGNAIRILQQCMVAQKVSG